MVDTVAILSASRSEPFGIRIEGMLRLLWSGFLGCNHVTKLNLSLWLFLLVVIVLTLGGGYGGGVIAALAAVVAAISAAAAAASAADVIAVPSRKQRELSCVRDIHHF